MGNGKMRGDGPEFELLFWSKDGLDARRQQVAAAARAVDQIPEAQFREKTDDQIVDGVLHSLCVAVPVLRREDTSYDRQTKTVNWPNSWGEVARREVVVFYFETPFDGDAAIFSMRPNQYNTNPPRGEVRGSVLRVSVMNEEDPERLKQAVDSTLNDVEEYLGWHRQMWAGIDQEIAQEARSRLAQRRQHLANLGAAEKGLSNMGFKPKGT
jgi:hypothetical protein